MTFIDIYQYLLYIGRKPSKYSTGKELNNSSKFIESETNTRLKNTVLRNSLSEKPVSGKYADPVEREID